MNIRSFYCYVRKLYCCDLLNWHPVYGVLDRPVKMDGDTFDVRLFQDHHWWMWPEYDNEVPSFQAMVDELEFAFGRFYRQTGNKFYKLKRPRAVKLTKPIKMVSKNLKLIYSWHLPPTTFAVRDDIKERAEEAYRLIKSGLGVREAMAATQSRYENIKTYTDFEPFRVKTTKQKVEEVIKLIRSGMNQEKALKQVGLPRFTFWNHTGGIKKIMNKKKENYDTKS